MKFTHFFNSLLIFTVAVCVSFVPAQLYAAGPGDAGLTQTNQEMFSSPDDAIRALRTAAEANDRMALSQIFGPEFQSLTTGDKVQDANDTHRFAAAIADNCQLDRQGDNEV